MLKLKGAVVLAPEVRERAKDAFDILEEVQDSIRKMGIPDYPRPDNLPTALGNVDVGKMSNREIETLYVQYMSYAQYLAPKLAVAESASRISASNLKHVAATIKNQLAVANVPKTDHDARVKENAEYITQETEDLKMFCTKTILESYYKSYANQAKALSRVVELRKLEQEQSMRGNHIGSVKPKGRVPGGFMRPR